MSKIFICYRQEDTKHIAAWMHEKLAERFGEDSVFFDVDSIPIGGDFSSYITNYIEQSDVLIAVIGPKWALITFDESAKAETRRIDDPMDYVRIELEMAICRNIPILPVLISDAVMPDKKTLPPSLAPLRLRIARRINDGQAFKSSMEALFNDLEEVLNIPYDIATELAIKGLRGRINTEGGFDVDAFKLAAKILNESEETKDRALLTVVKLFAMGQMDESSFVTWLRAENRRQSLGRILKCPEDVEAKLKMELLLSLPYVRRNKNGFDAHTALQDHFNALRDHLIMYIMSLHTMHIPKLIGVTSCGKGAGGSTVAAGLAIACSKTQNGNALLVDVNISYGTAIHFYRGQPLGDLNQSDGDARVEEYRYVTKEPREDNNKAGSSPADKFSRWLMKFKASNYDSIIFEMPPMSPISITPGLAYYMDAVLLVFEARKTKLELAMTSNKILIERKVKTFAVLNKFGNLK